MFVFGILLYEIQSIALLKAPSDSLALLALTGALTIMVIPNHGPAMGMLQLVILAAGFSSPCYACFNLSGWLARTFSWRSLHLLGNMSYPYYLTHVLTVTVFVLLLARWLPPTGSMISIFWLLLPSIFAATLIPAALLFVMVEKPYSLQPGRTGGSRRTPGGESSYSS